MTKENTPGCGSTVKTCTTCFTKSCVATNKMLEAMQTGVPADVLARFAPKPAATAGTTQRVTTLIPRSR